ncbi:methionyl-tRNA formyltransferase [Scopulibacillus darangshiensis]|uniref:Methionyl-tRNA formyltransferase n=1 Tax=Scopulibacillus darangshiensis TaxID=442528 RepID=A0A4R2P304_9BACL|nr:methionyl-tRNA formyltransferase [Scopulibacillus darangshiensis]TCP29129.1 methionyl-tRNA formyltransferase [Scopulibacillus darangshiensis]
MNVVFMGTPDFSVAILQRLIDDGHAVQAVVTQPDRPKGRKKQLTAPPVKELALKYDLPVLQPEKVRLPEVVEDILSYHPDLIVTAAYGQILPESLLKVPKLGCINVHASLLPKYRGGAPIHQAIIDGEDVSGITIMYMVKALDAGDMLTQVKVPISEDDTVGSLHDKLSLAGAELLSETLPAIEKGQITATPQNDDEATYAPTIQRKNEEIHWDKTGEDIYNQIRGLNPFPGAFTVFGGKVMKLWRTEKVKVKKLADPGTVIYIEKDGFVIATGNGTAVKVTECQPAGKKRMSAAQFLLGGGIETGEKLGNPL